MIDTIVVNAVSITPAAVNAGDQFKIVVDVLFLRPIGTLLFDRAPYDHGVWSPEP